VDQCITKRKANKMAARKAIKKFFKRGSKQDADLPTPRKNIDKALSKSVGERAADVTQPADIGTLGRKSLNANDPGFLSELQVEGGKTFRASQALKSTEKEIEKLQKKLKALKSESEDANKNLIGADRIKTIKSLKSQKDSVQEQIGLLNTRIKDLTKRYPIGQDVQQKLKGVVKQSGGKIVDKKQQMAAADWMQGLSQKEIEEILGKPSRDKEGVKRSDKKTTTKTRAAKSGGSIGCGKAMRGHGKGPYKKKGM